MTNSGTVWSGPYCIPKEANINCFGSINGVETERLTFDPMVGKFGEKLYSTVRQAVQMRKHVWKILMAQRDILSAPATESVTQALQGLDDTVRRTRKRLRSSNR
jgi:hypothetical protein